VTPNRENSQPQNSLGVEFPVGTPMWLQEAIIEDVRLDLEAEFQFWCKRQVQKGKGVDFRTASTSDEPFLGLRCFKCSFVYINPTIDLVYERSPLHLLAENLGNYITGRDRQLVCANCPRCGDICISNLLPKQYSKFEQLLNIFVRFRRRHSKNT
jgi:hypothetical protein